MLYLMRPRSNFANLVWFFISKIMILNYRVCMFQVGDVLAVIKKVECKTEAVM